MKGVERITKERKRQITREGWTAEHDTIHVKGELALAAICYARALDGDKLLPEDWPWESCWWKPSKSRIRNLEKAGALIAAEIDRLIQQEYEDSNQ